MLVLLAFVAAFVARLMGHNTIAVILLVIAGGMLVTSDGWLGQAVHMGGDALTWIGHQADKLA